MLLSPTIAPPPSGLGVASFHPVTAMLETLELTIANQHPVGSTLITAENRLASSFFPEKVVVLRFQQRTALAIKSSVLARKTPSSIAVS